MEPRIDKNLGIHGEPDAWIHSACILCSNGCGLDIAVKGGRIVGVRGDPRHPVNFGHLGPKGENAWVANSDPRRGTRPMIHSDDAEQLGIGFGDLVEVTSPHGVWEGPAMVVDTVLRGELFIPFHYGWGTQSANQHTWYARDPMSHQPQLKSAPVAIWRKGFGAPEQWLFDRYDDLAGKSIEPYAARTIGGTINQEVATGLV